MEVEQVLDLVLPRSMSIEKMLGPSNVSASRMLYDLAYSSAVLRVDLGRQGTVMGSGMWNRERGGCQKKNMSNIATSSVRVFSVILALSSQKSTKSKGGHGDIDGWQHQAATAIGSL